MNVRVALLIFGMLLSPLVASAAAGTATSHTFGTQEDAEGGLAAGSIDAWRCTTGDCGRSAYDRSRGLRTDPSAYVNGILDTQKPFVPGDSDTAI